MVRSYSKLIFTGVMAAALAVLALAPSFALALLSPTPDQAVRENVVIKLAAKDLPPDFVVPSDEKAAGIKRPFLAVFVGKEGAEQLVAAMSPDEGKLRDGVVIFTWNSKAPFYDPAEPSVKKYFKDGSYSFKVQVHDSTGKTADSASVNIELKNRVARSNPAPAVRLVNNLPYGSAHTYKVHADVQVFHRVNGVGLPILGGMGMTSDFRVVQSVEDVRPNGEILLRCRMDPNSYIGAFGKKSLLFPGDTPKPQLYRLVDKLGHVITRNVFSRQGKYTIMDVLPVLPARPVKEGAAWPAACDLKIEGVTPVIPLTGSSMLDSFEWQSGRECVKIISKLTGSSRISMNNDKIRSSSDKVDVEIVTYFAYKTGHMLRREITMEFPALIMPGAEDVAPDMTGQDANGTASPLTAMMRPIQNYADTANALIDDPYGEARPVPTEPGMPDTKTAEESAKKGSVQAHIVVTLEK